MDTLLLPILFVLILSKSVMICDNCGKEGAHTRYITRCYGKGNNLLLIENVPVITCPQCGESYQTAATLQEIERIKQHRTSLTQNRTIPVAVFG